MWAKASLLAFLVFVAACSSSISEVHSDCEPTPAAVLSTAKGLVEADNAHELERVLSHYTDDIVFITPEGELVEGKHAVSPRYEALFESFVVDIETKPEEVVVEGHWAFLRGRNVGTLASRASDDVRELDDRFLMILRCEPDDGWRVSRLMWVPVR